MTTDVLTQFAAGVSATCQNAADVCLKNLPQGTSADGSTVQTVLQVVIGIVAAVSVVFVALGAFRYIVSQGEPQAISKAKATIVYALIGVVVAILAQAIVILIVNFITPA